MSEDMIDDTVNDETQDEVIEAVDVEEPALIAVPLDDPQQQRRLVEALLFASPEPIKLRAIQARLPDTADVGFILTELQKEYSERGVHLVQFEDAWAFRTAPDIGPQLVLNKKEEKRLSKAALETLSIIAYHQPVTRAEVENIRGVATNKGTLDVLMEAGWVKPGRRLETPGRPVTWVTTTQFLDDFGVSDLNDLPGLAELKSSGLLDTRPAIDTIPGARDLFSIAEGANENNPQEGDEISGEFDQISDEAHSEDALNDDELSDEELVLKEERA